MPHPSDSVENKILLAAIECVEKYGLQGANNRRIAESAGVNLAAINYYFRSKENLITRVMQTTLDNAFDWKDFEDLPKTNAKERCIAIFLNLMEGGCNYPGMTRAHFYELLTEGNYDSLIAERYNGFILALAKDLSAIGTELNNKELHIACTQIAAACFMGILAPKLHSKALGIDLCDPKTRQAYIRRLVDRLL